jgi:hypothetical protein
MITMGTIEILKEIQSLSIQKRIYVVEQIIRSIRRQEDTNQMKNAADELYADYKSDKELTIFTNLDFENFYETR